MRKYYQRKIQKEVDNISFLFDECDIENNDTIEYMTYNIIMDSIFSCIKELDSQDVGWFFRMKNKRKLQNMAIELEKLKKRGIYL